ncbi:MAG: hypothetical protein OIF32_04940 [Campylobacterales bacterium]|nr:hypothetical protein [Campylobacterales bacterium]
MVDIDIVDKYGDKFYMSLIRNIKPCKTKKGFGSHTTIFYYSKTKVEKYLQEFKRKQSLRLRK